MARTRTQGLLLFGLVAALGLWLASVVVRLAVVKEFSVDEFEYAHGAWLIARGEVIYRDFFEAHLPLVHQLMALPWLGLADDPTNILFLRAAMLPLYALLIGAAWLINHRQDRTTGLVTPVVLLGTASLTAMAVEIRPDTVAFAFFLAGVAVLSARLGACLRGYLAGVLVALSLWGTLKAVYYGAAVAAAFVADLVLARRRPAAEDRGAERPTELGSGGLVGSPAAFLAGALTVAAAIALYLTLTGSWAPFFRWTVAWTALHQTHYPGFPWIQNFLPFFAHHLWLFLFGAVGVVVTLRRLRASDRAHPDLLLLGLLATTLFSAAWQTAAYLYSFVPFMAVLGIFAARGIVGAYRHLAELRARRPAAAVLGLVLVSLLLVGEAAHVRTLFRQALLADNGGQMETLRLVRDLTAPGDPVFDIAGMRVARPGVHFFYFADAVIRDLWGETLATEVPANIVASGCTVYLYDPRFTSFRPELRRFLIENFQPLTPEVWLWGRRYEKRADEDLEAEFLAVREGRYFVFPPSVMATGALSLDGEAITNPTFGLTKGTHRLRASGPPSRFALLWLPPGGETWTPLAHPVPR